MGRIYARIVMLQCLTVPHFESLHEVRHVGCGGGGTFPLAVQTPIFCEFIRLGHQVPNEERIFLSIERITGR